MNLPDRIRIGPWVYVCTYKLMDDDGGSSFQKSTLDINSNLPNDERIGGTLYHEIFHQFLEVHDVKLPDKKEEQVVRAMEAGMVGFNKDNYELALELVRVTGKTKEIL